MRVSTIGYDTLSCHEHASKAERKKKNPKDEWEGATVRNQHNPCNNLFPVRLMYLYFSNNLDDGPRNDR